MTISTVEIITFSLPQDYEAWDSFRSSEGFSKYKESLSSANATYIKSVSYVTDKGEDTNEQK